MQIVVGLDCGGSSSRVLAVDADGNIVFKGQSGPANLTSTPESRLRRNLASALKGCPPVAAACGCFAGLLNEDQRSYALDLLRGLLPGAKVRAEPDYTAAFYAANVGTNLCVIAGTGSLVCSLREGRIEKSGGRGYLLGDEGSAFAYGRDALLHFLNAPDAASPRLRAAVEDVFDTTVPNEVVSAVYRSATPAGILAKLAKPLGLDARAHEPYALKAIESNTARLVDVVERHVELHLAGETIRVCLAGGLWKGSAGFTQAFEKDLRRRFPDRVASVEKTAHPPVYGAVLLARSIMNEPNHHGN